MGKNETTEYALGKESTLPKKVRAQKSQLKLMVITFWDWRGMIYTHYSPAGQTVNMAYYKKVITIIRAHILRKWPEYQVGK